MQRKLLSGNEAVAQAAYDAAVGLGTGYPGTPSTEILENFAALGGRAQWAPNEKVALEVGLGASFAAAPHARDDEARRRERGGRPAVHRGVHRRHGGAGGGAADDPGMASSQNEQDNRRYAVAAGSPCWSPPIRRRRTTSPSRPSRSPSAGRCRCMLPDDHPRLPLQDACQPARRPRRPRPAPTSSRDIRGPGHDPGLRPPRPPAARARSSAKSPQWNESTRAEPRHRRAIRELGIITDGVSYLHVARGGPGGARAEARA